MSYNENNATFHIMELFTLWNFDTWNFWQIKLLIHLSSSSEIWLLQRHQCHADELEPESGFSQDHWCDQEKMRKNKERE